MRVYVDTSVIGGCCDEEFSFWSLKLFEEFRNELKTMLISELTLQELEQAPDNIKCILNRFTAEQIEIIPITFQVLRLAESYVYEHAVGKGSIADAQHIAAATVARVDVVASWNFKHIVNLRRIQLYNAVNLKQGYSVIDIRTPREIVNEEDL